MARHTVPAVCCLLLLGAAFLARPQEPDAKQRRRERLVTRAHLFALRSALAMYESDVGRYPRLAPRTAEGILRDDAPALWAGLMNRPTVKLGGGPNSPYFQDWKASSVGLVTSAGRVTPLAQEQGDELRSPEFQAKHLPEMETRLVFLDSWGNPFHYREWASVQPELKRAALEKPLEREVAGRGPVKDVPHDLESVQLWSDGPNRINEWGAEGSDDVVTWREER